MILLNKVHFLFVLHFAWCENETFENNLLSCDCRAGWFIVIMTPIAVMTAISYFWWVDQMRERVRTPLDAPRLIGEDATLPYNDPGRFWGTYRSGVYFGLKTRSPQSPVVGLMWMTQLTSKCLRVKAFLHWNMQLAETWRLKGLELVSVISVFTHTLPLPVPARHPHSQAPLFHVQV